MFWKRIKNHGGSILLFLFAQKSNVAHVTFKFRCNLVTSGPILINRHLFKCPLCHEFRSSNHPNND